jgi:hypothetical protein
MSSVPESAFRPGRRRFLSSNLRGGVRPESWRFRACLDCGHLWGRLDPEELRRFILTQCTEETRETWSLGAKPLVEADDLA